MSNDNMTVYQYIIDYVLKMTEYSRVLVCGIYRPRSRTE